MSRKFIVAIAAIAALGMSTLLATDASARFGGGGGGGGGGGHFGGASHFSGGGASRTAFKPARISTNRTVSRTLRTTRGTKTSRLNRPNLKKPNLHHVHLAHHFHHAHWREWCRHHHHHRCGFYGYDVDVGVDGDVAPAVVADAPEAVAPIPVAAVCNNDCDYFLNNEPGCYMAKRAFSTPSGDELRCVKICEEPENTQAPK
jgi:hypothetical protein